MSLNNVSSSNIQANTLNAIINEINNLESGGGGVLNILMTNSTFLSLQQASFVWLNNNMTITARYIRGTNFLWLTFNTPGSNFSAANFPFNSNISLWTQAQWDSMAFLIPPGSTSNRPVASSQTTGGYNTVAGAGNNITITCTAAANATLRINTPTVSATGSATMVINPMFFQLTSPIP